MGDPNTPNSPEPEATDAPDGLDPKDLGEDGFDTIGFDYDPQNFQDPNDGMAFGAALAYADESEDIFNDAPAGAETPVSGTPIRSTTTISPADIAAAIAEFGVKIPEDEPDLDALQSGMIAVDFGSSDAVLATFNSDGKAVVVPNSLNERTTPARLLREENGDWLIGREARSLAPTMPEFDYGDIKSLLLIDGWQANIGGETFSAERLLTIFMERFLADIREQIDFEPRMMVLAAPVWFKEKQRQALASAVAAAGIEVVGVTDELLAACVPYSLRLPDLQARKAVVVDVGHRGTSIAFIQAAGGDLEILCQAGLPDLGAVNWDELLIAESVRKFNSHHGFDPRQDPTCMTDLNLRVEAAKKALSHRRSFNMPIQSMGKTLKVRFEREAFERASQGQLRALGSFLDKARERGNIESWSELDALVITGGGARIPMVRKVVEDTVGRKAEPFNVEENVAIGALYWGVAARHKALKKKKDEDG